MRITEKDLERIVLTLNTLTDSPIAYFGENRKVNIGHFCLDWAYGGVQLKRVVTESGGVTLIFPCGYVTKKDLYWLIDAYITGIELANARNTGR
jgi:hypothetical protein